MARSHPPKPRLTLRVGISGHRPNRLASGAEGRLREGIKDLFQGILTALDDIGGKNREAVASEPAEVRAVSPLAEGADRIFAQAARDLGLALYAPLPFPAAEYERDFADEASRSGFRKLLAEATVFEFVHGRDDQDLAYESAGLFTLRQCDLLIAVWNGEEGQGRGGTQEIIVAAIAAGVPIVRFDEKGDGPWILPWQARRTATTLQDLLKAAVPATPAALASLIESIVTPPADPEERRRLRKFYGERERLKNLWFAYPLVQRALTSWRRFRRSLFPPPYLAATLDDWRRDYWLPLGGSGQADAPHEALGRLAPKGVMGMLEERHAWADKLAMHFAQVYRSSYVSIFMLGALTVAFALMPVLFHSKPASTVIELVLIALATVIVVGGSRLNWHRRWLDYRRLAERLRVLRLLALTGSNASRFRVEHGPDDDRGGQVKAWTDWYVRMSAREIAMPEGRADDDYAAMVRRALVEGEIKSQIEFHAANAKRQHDMEHRLDLIGVWLFAATTAMLIGYLELYVLDWLAGGYETADPFSKAVTFLSGLFPALGAALFAMRVQGDFDESARLSNEMVARLKSLEAEAAAQGEAGFAAMSRLVEETAAALTADLSDWQLLYRGKPLTLAG